MNKNLIEENKNKPKDEIMKINEIYLVKPISSERYGKTDKFLFTFSMSGFTDPEWREIFVNNYDSDNIKFSGSELTITCKANELEQIVTQIKDAMSSANKVYKERKEKLLKEIELYNQKEKDLENKKKQEEYEVKEMFKNFKI